MSSALGSSTEASCWVARKILRSPVSASSSARTLDSRPTTNGVIIWGKMTMSRIGIIGSLRTSPVKTIFAWFAMLSPLDLPPPQMIQPAAKASSDCNASRPLGDPALWCDGRIIDSRCRVTPRRAPVHDKMFDFRNDRDYYGNEEG